MYLFTVLFVASRPYSHSYSAFLLLIVLFPKLHRQSLQANHPPPSVFTLSRFFIFIFNKWFFYCYFLVSFFHFLNCLVCVSFSQVLCACPVLSHSAYKQQELYYLNIFLVYLIPIFIFITTNISSRI